MRSYTGRKNTYGHVLPQLLLSEVTTVLIVNNEKRLHQEISENESNASLMLIFL